MQRLYVSWGPAKIVNRTVLRLDMLTAGAWNLAGISITMVNTKHVELLKQGVDR